MGSTVGAARRAIAGSRPGAFRQPFLPYSFHSRIAGPAHPLNWRFTMSATPARRVSGGQGKSNPAGGSRRGWLKLAVGAQNTNEERYLFQKAARLLGTVCVEHQARL